MSTRDSLLLDGRVMCSALATKTGQEVLYKQIFVNKWNAQAAANKANTRYSPYRKLVPYVCEHCGYWHNGRLATDASEAPQVFVVAGASEQVLQNLVNANLPLARETQELLQLDSSDLPARHYAELAEICQIISMPFVLDSNGWANVLSVGPEYWAVLHNLHIPLHNQVVMRIESQHPLLCRFWPELPEYSMLWHTDDIVVC